MIQALSFFFFKKHLACVCVCGLVRVAVGESQSLEALLHPFGEVRAILLVAGQQEAVVLAGGQDGVWVSFQARPLVVWEGHGEERLGVAHELVDVPLTGHLGANQRQED